MKKSFITMLLITFVSASLFGCGKGPSTDNGSSSKAPIKEDKDISIIYTTDVHCGVDEGDENNKRLGYAKVEAYKKNLEETNYVSLVDAGDYLQGEFIGAISKGKYMMDIINEMSYDVITLGNHEFDYGIDVLKSRLTEYKGDVVSCNFSYIGNKENRVRTPGIRFHPPRQTQCSGYRCRFLRPPFPGRSPADRNSFPQCRSRGCSSIPYPRIW